MRHIIFYSWQADLPNSTNRAFIQSALEDAARQIATDLNIEPVIERDTQNVPGSPDIATTIFKKIAMSDVFVADITLINPKSAKRRTPNPNVLLELGYALHAHSDERVVLVMNRAFGSMEALPFDLKMRRVIPYDMPESAIERAPERKRLASILVQAIKAAIGSIPPATPPPDETDAAITGIESGATNRSLLVKRSMSAIMTRLEASAPRLFRDAGTVDDLLAGLEATVPTVRRFSRLCEAIAGMNDLEGARSLMKDFAMVFAHYDLPRGFEGRFNSSDFDYWKFLGHELLTTLVAKLLSTERYEVIQAILEETITVSTNRRTTAVTFTFASEWLASLEPLREEHRRLSYHADLLARRHAAQDREHPTAGPLADVLPLMEFLAADYFLFLRAELETSDPRERGFGWKPWSNVYLGETPSFLHGAVRVTTAQRLASALGTPDVPTLKSRLRERAGKLASLWSTGMYDQPLLTEEVDRIGTR